MQTRTNLSVITFTSSTLRSDSLSITSRYYMPCHIMVALQTWHQRVQPVISLSSVHLHSRWQDREEACCPRSLPPCGAEIAKEGTQASMWKLSSLSSSSGFAVTTVQHITQTYLSDRADPIGPCWVLSIAKITRTSLLTD